MAQSEVAVPVVLRGVARQAPSHLPASRRGLRGPRGLQQAPPPGQARQLLVAALPAVVSVAGIESGGGSGGGGSRWAGAPEKKRGGSGGLGGFDERRGDWRNGRSAASLVRGTVPADRSPFSGRATREADPRCLRRLPPPALPPSPAGHPSRL